VDGCIDVDIIVIISQILLQQRAILWCTIFNDELLFDDELIGNVIDILKHGKAAGVDSLLADHLIHCHLSNVHYS